MAQRKERPLPSLDAILWTPEEVAAVLVIPLAEVERATASGDLASIRFGSRRRYRPEDVRTWVNGLVPAEKPTTLSAVETYRTPQAGTRAG